MKPLFRCEYCDKIGVEEEIIQHEQTCINNYTKRSCYTCLHAEVTEHQIPTKVCTVCGRIDYVDKDPKYYVRKEVPNLPFRAYTDELSKAALALPKWLAEDFFAKFAIKCEEV